MKMSRKLTCGFTGCDSGAPISVSRFLNSELFMNRCSSKDWLRVKTAELTDFAVYISSGSSFFRDIHAVMRQRTESLPAPESNSRDQNKRLREAMFQQRLSSNEKNAS